MPVILAWLAPYLFRIIVGVSIFAALGGGFVFVKIHYENIGRDEVIARDQGAITNAKSRVKKAGDCDDAGGEWFSPRGVCR